MWSSLSKTAAAAVLLYTLVIVLAPAARAGENFEALSLQPFSYTDRFWDKRLYDGTPGFDGAIGWSYNPESAPGIEAAEFVQLAQTGFQRWTVPNLFVRARLTPIFAPAGVVSVSPRAIDGLNTLGWETMDGLNGTLAITGCTYLTVPTMTALDGFGQTTLRAGRHTIPFPGPPGVTYLPGTLVDCGIVIDRDEPWRLTTDPDPFTLDLAAITWHEIGHLLGLTHSTVGLSSETSIDDATMIPFADETSNLRSLHLDDVTALLRSYLRVNRLNPVAGGFSRVTGRLVKNEACDRMATGVSIRVYQRGQGLEAASAQETFSATPFRRSIPGQSRNGAFDLNVLPGVEYTLAAILLSTDTGNYNHVAFNLTTILSNTTSPSETIVNNLATFGPLAPGETLDLGAVGILGCQAPGVS